MRGNVPISQNIYLKLQQLKRALSPHLQIKEQWNKINRPTDLNTYDYDSYYDKDDTSMQSGKSVS